MAKPSFPVSGTNKLQSPGSPLKQPAPGRRRRKPASRRLWTVVVPVILLLACANLIALWALWTSVRGEGGIDDLGQIAGGPTSELFSLPQPGLPLESTPTATLVVNITPTATKTPTATPTPIPPPASPQPAPPVAPAPPAPAAPPETPAPVAIQHVVIISVDGLRPDALSMANTPALDNLIARGTYCPSAQTVSISRTLPGHASMLTGMLPEKHGIVWGEPYIGWPGMNGPTIFSVASEAGLSTAMVFGKDKLSYLALPNSVGRLVAGDVDDTEVKNRAIDLIRAGLPDVLFIHFPDTDRVGHTHGWMSEQQFQAISFTDSLIGAIVAELEQAGYLESTLLIVSADHGGHGKNHGDDSPEDRTIPWLAVGPGVPAGVTLARTVNTYDTAPTAAYALNLPIPEVWDGRPVLEIFE